MATHIPRGSDLSSPMQLPSSRYLSHHNDLFASVQPLLLTPLPPSPLPCTPHALLDPVPAPACPSLGSQRQSIKRLSDFLRALPRSCYAPQSYETVRTLLQGLPGSMHRGGMGPPSAAGTVSSTAGWRGRYPLMMFHASRGMGPPSTAGTVSIS